MSRLKSASPSVPNFEEVWERIGRVPLNRIRMKPAPGSAKEKDVTAIHDREGRNYELVEGVLVEKGMGLVESCIAKRLGTFMAAFAEQKDVGFVAGEGGTIRLAPGLVRIPDVAFYSWEQLPKKFYPKEPIPELAPYLGIEVISASNTKAEMDLKLRDYFLNGVRLVWYIDPNQRTAQIYTAPDEMHELTEADALDGGDVLPGFTLPLADLFRYVEPKPSAKRKKKTGR